MIAVAVVAIVAAATLTLQRRSARHRALARDHARRAALAPFQVTFLIDRGNLQSQYAQGQAKQRWHRRLQYKYERAARHPWFPVPPDPPPPK